MMKPFIVFLDAGHGGMVNGKYVTLGKRSPKMDDGTVLYEGVHNRIIAKLVYDRLSEFSKNEILPINVSPGDLDTPLENRVKKANDGWLDAGRPSAIYVSIHSDAAGDGINWHPASGMSVYTSKGQTKSDVFAAILLDVLKEEFNGEVRWREDFTDGDGDKEENFYVLRETLMPAALVELGFHTNKEECEKMFTKEWNQRCASSIVKSIIDYKKLVG